MSKSSMACSSCGGFHQATRTSLLTKKYVTHGSPESRDYGKAPRTFLGRRR